MASKTPSEGLPSIICDDIATPADGPRLLSMLAEPLAAFSCPERIRLHLGLSDDEKRVALCAWLLALLKDGLNGRATSIAVQTALGELADVDLGAAAVLRRAFDPLGLATPS